MDDDRQSRIDEIVQSAFRLDPDKRASYLAQACEDDEVREEVTRTLAIRADLREPPSPSPAPPDQGDVRHIGRHTDRSPAETPPRDRRIDQTYGIYKVTRRIGSGGMGEVYLASDTRLDRQVALKFLPAHTVSDESILRRFQSEARTASALNHPNILTIFDVGKFGRDHYIASEFVEGVTLRARLRRGPFELIETVEIVTQVASALMAAHSAGVIHRDLKPTNIMLRPDGYVKVIDFGLAKRIRSIAEASLEEGFTHPGTMIGTVDYMSPEQARGEDVDPRTDLWSVGVIFHEMLAGSRPFPGESEYHVVAQILESDPKPVGPPGALPPEVERILERCLQKDRNKRYASAGDLYADLREARRALNLSSITRHSVLQRRKPASRRRAGVGLAASVLLLAGVGWWWEAWGQGRFLGPDLFEVGPFNQVTFSGQTEAAAISPDGLSLAYVSGPAHSRALYVAQIAGDKVDPGSNSKRIPEADVEYQGVTFSNDGRTIYFVLRSHNWGTLYKIPVTGGEQQPVVADIDGPVAVNPDTGELAFLRILDPHSAIVVAGGKHNQQGDPVYAITGLLGKRLAWAKNSRELACFRYPDAGHRNFQVQVLRPAETGKQATLRRTVDLAGWSGASQPVWLKNGRDLITASRSNDESEENMQLREVSTVNGRTRDLTNGLYGYHGASLTASEDKLVTIRLDRETSFWFAPASNLRDGRVRSGDSGRYDHINWTDDGQVLAQAKRGNGVDVWLINPSGGEPRIMTDGRSVYREPVWLPQHKSFVVASHREGMSGIWRFDVKDGSYHLLASGPGYMEAPSCSTDGSTVYYTVWDLNEPSIWVASTGSKSDSPRRLLVDARNPIVSPDGKNMAVEFVDKSNKSGWRVSVIDLDSLAVKFNFPRVLTGSRLRWMPDGSGLTYIETDDQETSNILIQKLSSPPSLPEQMTEFHENQIFDYAWSPDGKSLVCLKGHVSSDAFLLVRKESWIGSMFAR